MHTEENLELKGLMDRNRAVEYVNRLLNYISVNYNEIWGDEEAAALALRRLASKLQDIADRIAPQQGIERIELSDEDYNAIMQYY